MGSGKKYTALVNLLTDKMTVLLSEASKQVIKLEELWEHKAWGVVGVDPWEDGCCSHSVHKDNIQTQTHQYQNSLEATRNTI